MSLGTRKKASFLPQIPTPHLPHNLFRAVTGKKERRKIFFSSQPCSKNQLQHPVCKEMAVCGEEREEEGEKIKRRLNQTAPK